MSGRHVTFYHEVTGVLHDKSVYVSDPEAVALNTPPDHVAIDHPAEGMLDPRTHRVDVSTGKAIISNWPARPENPAVRRRAISRQIAALEASQHRPVRELALDENNEAARSRLVYIEVQIAKLRAALSGDGEASGTPGPVGS
jgi:hypothetical protein